MHPGPAAYSFSHEIFSFPLPSWIHPHCVCLQQRTSCHDENLRINSIAASSSNREVFQLPTDIVLSILSHFEHYGNSNRQALSACALVCHEWLPLARECQFRVLKFGRRIAHDINQLSRLLDSPHLMTYVRELEVRGTMPRQGLATIPLGDLRRLVDPIPHLKHVRLSRFILVATTDLDRSEGTRTDKKKLDSLSVECLQSAVDTLARRAFWHPTPSPPPPTNVAHIADVLDIFSDVKELHLLDFEDWHSFDARISAAAGIFCDHPSHNGIPPEYLPFRPTVQSLTIKKCGWRTTIAGLRSLCSAQRSTLKTLILDVYRRAVFVAMNEAIQTLGLALRHLDLNLLLFECVRQYGTPLYRATRPILIFVLTSV